VHSSILVIESNFGNKLKKNEVIFLFLIFIPVVLDYPLTVTVPQVLVNTLNNIDKLYII